MSMHTHAIGYFCDSIYSIQGYERWLKVARCLILFQYSEYYHDFSFISFLRSNNTSHNTCSTDHCKLYSLYIYIYIYRMMKNIFNKNETRCRDVKTQKACKQGWKANIVPKIKQTTSI